MDTFLHICLLTTLTLWGHGHVYIQVSRLTMSQSQAIKIFKSLCRSATGSFTRTEIPTIIDPVALGYFIVALGSIIVGISVPH